jgi:isocitrate lyase
MATTDPIPLIRKTPAAEVGAGCFEEVALAITGGESETTALSGSTEESQF